MNADLRDRIREAVDARARERVTYEERVCQRCGIDADSRTVGCKACSDRHSHRAGRRRARAAA